MASRPAGGKIEREIALLRDPDDRKRTLDAGDHPLHERSSFVEDHRRLRHAARTKQPRHLPRPPRAADFLVSTEGEVDRAERPMVVAEQLLRRLEDGDDRALVVERPATVDEPSLDRAGEGRMCPARLGAGEDWDHVEVRHQHDRGERFVGPGPSIQEGALPDPLAPKTIVHERVGVTQILAEATEGRPLAGAFARGDRLEPDRAGEVLGDRRRVHRRPDGILRRIGGADPGGAPQRDPGNADDHRAERAENGPEPSPGTSVHHPGSASGDVR